MQLQLLCRVGVPPPLRHARGQVVGRVRYNRGLWHILWIKYYRCCMRLVRM